MNPKLKEHARNLRKNYTDAEDHLWYYLRNRQLNGFKFTRQRVIEPYIVDFVCHSKKLIIELDGGQHVEQELYDQNRTEFLKEKGYKVLRFWNVDVLKDVEGVLDVIVNELEK